MGSTRTKRRLYITQRTKAPWILFAFSFPIKPKSMCVIIRIGHPCTARFPSNEIDIAQMLIGAGARISEREENGWTPRCLASAIGNLEIVRALIAAGADPLVGTSDPMHMTALQRATPRRRDVVEELLNASSQAAALKLTLERKSFNVARTIVEIKARKPSRFQVLRAAALKMRSRFLN